MIGTLQNLLDVLVGLPLQYSLQRDPVCNPIQIASKIQLSNESDGLLTALSLSMVMILCVSGNASSLPWDHFVMWANSFFIAGKGSPLSIGRPSGE